MTLLLNGHGAGLLRASARFTRAETGNTADLTPMPLDTAAEFAIVFAKEGLPTSLGFYFDPSAWQAGAPLMHLMSHDLAMYPLGAGVVEHADNGKTAMMVGRMRASAEQDPEIMAYATSYNIMIEQGVMPEASAGFFANEMEVWDKADANGQYGRVTQADGIETSRVYRGAHPETSIRMFEASAVAAAHIAGLTPQVRQLKQNQTHVEMEQRLRSLKQAEQLRHLEMASFTGVL